MIDNRTFLESVFVDMPPNTHTIITAFHGDPATKDRNESARFWCGRAWFPGDRVPGHYDTCNSYFTVAGFEPEPASGELRRRKEQFVMMGVVMLDDVGTKVSHDKVALQPSALIETSPGNYQGSYFLKPDADARNRDTCERLVNRMVAAGLAINSTDPGMKGVTRYARLPVGTNQKPKYTQRLGRAFTVRLASFEPERRYSIMEIARAYRLDMTPDTRQVRAVNLTSEQIKRADESFTALLEVFEAMNMYHGKNSGSRWHQVTCPWISAHTDSADTGAALSEPSADNHYAGGFVCHHGHCRQIRGMKDVRAWIRALAHVLGESRSAA